MMACKMAAKLVKIAGLFVPRVVRRVFLAPLPKIARVKNAKDPQEIPFAEKHLVSMAFGTATKRITIAVDPALTNALRCILASWIVIVAVGFAIQ